LWAASDCNWSESLRARRGIKDMELASGGVGHKNEIVVLVDKHVGKTVVGFVSSVVAII
jgi:hypothetical protein